MRKGAWVLAGAIGSVALAQPASAATIILTEEDGDFTGHFGMTVTDEGVFSDTYTFELPVDGQTAAAVSTIAVSMWTNIDFTSVLLNGTPFTLNRDGDFESGFLTLPTMAGMQTLVVNGRSGGNASYGGTISFTPNGALPEPGTWLLMLLGFGAVGFALRRHKPEMASVSVSYV